MRKVAMSVLLGVWALMAGAGDLPPPKKEALGIQKSTNAPTSGVARKDLIFNDKSRNGAPQASKKPPAPLLLLDEKNLSMGCAQPS